MDGTRTMSFAQARRENRLKKDIMPELKTFIVGFSYKDKKLIEYPNKTDADNLAEDWVEIKAVTLENAIENYDEHFDTWQKSFEEDYED
jgi:hypothetical protein